MECLDGNGNEFGEQWLLSVLDSARGDGLARIKAGVRSALEQHVAGAPLDDDVTFLVVEVG